MLLIGLVRVVLELFEALFALLFLAVKLIDHGLDFLLGLACEFYGLVHGLFEAVAFLFYFEPFFLDELALVV